MNDKAAIIDQRPTTNDQRPTTNDQRPTTNDQRPTTNDQRPTTNDPIHVALAVYDPAGTYSQHAGVTITSIFENTKSKVIIHLLHDETLTEDNRKKFIRTAEKYNQTIEFIDISEYAARISDELVKVSEKWTIGCCYKLLIPDIFPTLEKIIYLDCDILVNLDINELWNIYLEGKSIAASLDEVPFIKISALRRTQFKISGCNKKTYINSGMLVMNLKKIHEKGEFFTEAHEWLLRHSHMPLFPDQDALNSIFRDDIKFLDERFNLDILNRDISNTIFHMWRSKPWREFINAPHQILYWDMYLRSAWGENITPHELIEKLSIISGSMKDSLTHSHEMHHSFKQCLRRIIAGIWHKITFSEKRKVIKLILKDKIYRLKYKFRH